MEKQEGPGVGERRRRILGFRLDPEAEPFSFADRLARENGWSREFALRVVREDAVDQAWHLHLIFWCVSPLR